MVTLMRRLLQQFSHHRLPLLLAGLMMLLCWQATRLQNFQQPPLPEDRVWVKGQIAGIQAYDTRTRLQLRDVTLYGLHTPVRRLNGIRLSLSTSRWEKLGATTGEGLAAQAKLHPIPQPDFPGDSDPTHYAQRDHITATGYVMGDVEVTFIPLQPTLWDTVNRLRQSLYNIVSQRASPLAAAFVTGIRTGIPQEVSQHFRHAGLAHLLAISGLHLGMVGGLIFFVLRYLFTLWPRLALTWPTKKIAAGVALLGAGSYMLLAGATIPTVRAFIMLGFLLLAVMVDRPHLSLRLWALAVVTVLAIWPESVVSASFQMSFTATLALILWAVARPHHHQRRIGYITGILTASLLAGLATMPLAAAHFGMVSFSGFLLNLLAIPLLGFWILPLGLISLMLLPVGLSGWFFTLMEQGVNLLTYLAAWGDTGWFGQLFGGWQVPHAAWPVLAVISLLGIGGMVLHRQRWAVLAVVLAALVCAVWPKTPPADIIVLDGGATVLLCPDATGCTVARADDGDRTWQRFLRIYHLGETTLPATCDGDACVYQLHGQNILITETPTQEDCAHADRIFSKFPNRYCKSFQLKEGVSSAFVSLKNK